MSHTFTTTVGDDESTPLHEVTITYDYTPPEPRTWDHPGAPLEIELLSVVNDDGEEMYPKLLSDFDEDRLIEEAIEHLDFVTKDALVEREASRRGINLWATR